MINNLKELDKLSKERIHDKSNDRFYEYANRMYRKLMDFVNDLGFGEDVGIEIRFYPLERGVTLDVTVDNIAKQINSIQMYRLTTEFDELFRNQLSYVVNINETGEYDLLTNGKEFYVYHDTENKDYDFISKFSNNLKDILNKVPEYDTNYEPKLEVVVEDEDVWVDFGLGDGREGYSDSYKVVSRYLAYKLNFGRDCFDEDVMSKIQENDKSSKESIQEEIDKVRDFFDKELENLITKSNVYFNTRYELKLERKIVMNVIVSGFGLDYNYLNGKDYIEGVKKLSLKYIDLNVVVNSLDIMDSVIGSFDKHGRRVDKLVTVLKTNESMDYLGRISKVVKDTLKDEHFNLNTGNGKILIDITNKEEGLESSKEYTSSNGAILYKEDIKMYIRIGDGGSRLFSNEEKEELSKSLTKENLLDIYNFIN